MANKADGKSVSAPVSYTGDSIQKKLFWVGLILLSAGLLIKSCSGPGKVAAKQPPVCADSATRHISLGESVPQKVRKDCLSSLIIPNGIIGELVIEAPGEVYLCLWSKDRCVGMINTKDNNSQELEKKEIPLYDAVRLIGDEGIAMVHFRLSR